MVSTAGGEVVGVPDLPTLGALQQTRRAKPKGSQPTRLEQKFAQAKLRVVDEKAFKHEVLVRDGNICRKCGCKVVATMERKPNRREVHHIHGRIGALRFESRAALVLCLRDHARCTGEVSDKLVIVPTKTFELEGKRYTDARYAVSFQRVP